MVGRAGQQHDRQQELQDLGPVEDAGDLFWRRIPGPQKKSHCNEEREKHADHCTGESRQGPICSTQLVPNDPATYPDRKLQEEKSPN